MRINFLLLLFVFSYGCKPEITSSAYNVVNVRLSGEPAVLDPIRSTNGLAKQIEAKLFLSLLQYDANDFSLYPVLATERPQVEVIDAGPYTGGRKYTFELRSTATWDDGESVQVSDIEFSLKMLLCPKISSPAFIQFLSFIKAVETAPTNPQKFTIVTDLAMNLGEEVIGTVAIYPKHLYDPTDALGKYSLKDLSQKELIEAALASDQALSDFVNSFLKKGYSNTIDQLKGCGPYQIKEWLPGQRLSLEKKKNWWGEQIQTNHYTFGNTPDQLVYHFVKEDATLATLLKDQTIDVAASIAPTDFKQWQQNEWMQERFNFFTPTSASYYFVAFNTKNEKLADRTTRLALSHLMNIEEVIRVVMEGYASPLVGPVLPNKTYYHPDLEVLQFDPDKAKSLLATAGWIDQDQDGILEKIINGTRVDLELSYKYTTNNKIEERVGFLLKNNAEKAGVKIILEGLERNKFIEDTRRRDFDLYCSRWSQRPGLDDLRSIWHTDNDTPLGYNKAGFGNAKTDALIDSINIVMDEKKRDELYWRIQEIIYEEQPYIFLFIPQERIVIHKKIKGQVYNLRPGYMENTFRFE